MSIYRGTLVLNSLVSLVSDTGSNKKGAETRTLIKLKTRAKTTNKTKSSLSQLFAENKIGCP
jgi:hypothetical protein